MLNESLCEKLKKTFHKLIEDYQLGKRLYEERRRGPLYVEGNLGIFPNSDLFVTNIPKRFDSTYDLETYVKMIRNASDNSGLFFNGYYAPRLEFFNGHVEHGYRLFNVSNKKSGNPIVALLGCSEDKQRAYSCNLGFRAYSDFLPSGLCKTRVFPACASISKIQNSDLRMFLMAFYEEMEANTRFGV